MGLESDGSSRSSYRLFSRSTLWYERLCHLCNLLYDLHLLANGEIVSDRNLHSEWRLWHELCGIGPVHDLNTFRDLDGYISEYKFLVMPSKLQEGASLHCFIGNFDLTYAEGYWTSRFRLSDADGIWQNSVLALIEEKIFPHKHVVGIRAEIRGKFVDMTLWTKNASSKDCQLRIAKNWKYFTRYSYLMGYALVDGHVKQKIPSEKYIYRLRNPDEEWRDCK